MASKGMRAVYLLKNHDENTKTPLKNSVVNFKHEVIKQLNFNNNNKKM